MNANDFHAILIFSVWKKTKSNIFTALRAKLNNRWISRLKLNNKPGPIKRDWTRVTEVFFTTLIEQNQAWAKREKTCHDSREKFEQVQIRRERTRVEGNCVDHAREFQAKREREFEFFSIFVLAWPGFYVYFNLLAGSFSTVVNSRGNISLS